MKKRTVVLIVGILLVIVGFTGCSSKTGVINMATKPMTEQYILGSMIKILIEQDTDLTVNITEGVGGGTSNIQPAMELSLIHILYVLQSLCSMSKKT